MLLNGDSTSFTLKGITVWKTASPYWRRIVSSTTALTLVRRSTIVTATPPIRSGGFSCRTIAIVSSSCGMAFSAKTWA